MGRVSNRPDSYSPLLVELQFVKASPAVMVLTGPVPGTAGSDVIVRPDRYLRSLRVESNADSAWRGTIVLFDNEEDYIESLLTPLDPSDRVVKFRWGWDQGEQLRNVAWSVGRVVQWESTYTFEGVELSLELLGSSFHAAQVDKVVRSFPAGRTPTEIVREIADARGWKTQDKDGNETIEDTDYQFDKPLQQTDESDTKFIRQSVLPEATDADGDAFSFWVDVDDVVHFHTRKHLLRAENRPRLAATYTYARDPNGEVIAFTPQNTHLFSKLGGGEDAVYYFTDEELGRRVQIETSRDGGPDNFIVSFPDEKTLTYEGEGKKARIPLTARSIEEGRQMIRARYSRNRNAAYAATLEVRGTHRVRVGDHIAVRYIKRTGAEHYLSGVYWVKGVQQDVSTGEWKTSFDLQRAGAKAQESTQSNDRINAAKQQAIEENIERRGVLGVPVLAGGLSEEDRQALRVRD